MPQPCRNWSFIPVLVVLTGFPCPGLASPDRLGADSPAIAPPLSPEPTTISGVWRELSPPNRRSHVMILDEPRHRLVAFGGLVSERPSSALWTLDLDVAGAQWRLLDAVGEAPSPRFDAAAVYDPVRDRMLLFGGRDSAYHVDRSPTRLFNDFWELNLRGHPRWRRLSTSGIDPGGRAGHTLTIDPEHDRLLLCGGRAIVGTPEYESETSSNDVWALPLFRTSSWERLVPRGTAPAVRTNAAAVYDPVLHGLLLFGGQGYSASDCFEADCGYLDDLWLLSTRGATEWVPLAARGDAPCRMAGHAMSYDAVREQAILLGGADRLHFGCHQRLQPVWAFSSRDLHWRSLSPSAVAPFASSEFGIARDPANGRIFVFGRSETWTLDATDSASWSRTTADEIPSATSNWESAWDSRRHRLLIEQPPDLWSYSPDAPAGWRRMARVGAAPPFRYGFATAYDSLRDRLLVVGGTGEDGRAIPLSEIWSYSFRGEGWSVESATHAPLSRSYSRTVVDVMRDRLILFGGIWNFLTPTNEAWTLDLETLSWDALPTCPSPVPHAAGSVILDRHRGDLVIFGGGSPWVDGWYTSGDLWALSMSGASDWRLLDRGGRSDVPKGRAGAATAWDANQDRLVVVGGGTPGFGWSTRNDSWSWDFGTQHWSRIDTGPSTPDWSFPIGAWNPETGETVVLEGHQAWALRLMTRPTRRVSRNLDAAPSQQVTLGLAMASVQRSHSVFAEVSLPRAESARLALFDLAGRRLWSSDMTGWGSGTHHIEIDEKVAAEPGVYFLRLDRPGGAGIVRRFVRVR